MAPLLCGLAGALVGAYSGLKGEWPGITIMIFATVGFALAYGLALAVIVNSLRGI